MLNILDSVLKGVDSGEEELFIRLLQRPTRQLKEEVDTLASKIDEIASMALKMPLVGIDGVNGKDGINGIDGKDGIDGKNGLDGLDGVAGKDGKDGIDGVNGVSVVDADISADDHLVLSLSNGEEIDAGLLPSAQSISQAIATVRTQQQVTVSTIAPTNPQINDLWLQI